jgi:hypothetical protein
MQSRPLTEPMRCWLSSPTTCAALDAAENRGNGNVTEPPRCPTFLSPESRWRRRGPKGRIELAGLPGLHLARRGFWGATVSHQLAAAVGSKTLTAAANCRCQLPLPTDCRRRCLGTGKGPTPYSCLAPPRLTATEPKQPSDGRPCLNHPGAEADDFKDV